VTVTFSGDRATGSVEGLEEWSLAESPFSATRIEPEAYGEGGFTVDTLRDAAAGEL
jgi:hypothetical protein